MHNFREPEPRRYRELVNPEGIVVIKPDCLFTIAGQRYALEAETGTQSLPVLTRKLQRYARYVDLHPAPAYPLRLLVRCGHAVRANQIHNAIRGARIDPRWVGISHAACSE